MERERPLDADPERLLAHREGLPKAGALALDADALEDLDPLPVPLDDLEVHAQGVPRLELREVRAQVALLEALDRRVHERGRPRKGRGMLPERDPVRRPVGHEDLADEVLARHASPDAGVARRGAVVAHHEVLALRDAEGLLRADVAPVVLDVRLLEPLPVDVDVRRAQLRLLRWQTIADVGVEGNRSSADKSGMDMHGIMKNLAEAGRHIDSAAFSIASADSGLKLAQGALGKAEQELTNPYRDIIEPLELELNIRLAAANNHYTEAKEKWQELGDIARAKNAGWAESLRADLRDFDHWLETDAKNAEEARRIEKSLLLAKETFAAVI